MGIHRASDQADQASVPPQASSELVFVKLGGSVITDKRRARTARLEVIRRLAGEIAEAVADGYVGRLILGHGSGSYGHWVAKQYGTREGVHTPAQWRGYYKVAAAAADLNRIVAEALRQAGVPAKTIRPSASARCKDGMLAYLDTGPVSAALAQGLVPLVYGDVALDSVRGGTIVSTEDIFVYLADRFEPARILLAGEVAGVLRPDGGVIGCITPKTFPEVASLLSGAAGVDVTGGMADKVARMVELVDVHPRTQVHVLSGAIPELLGDALRDPSTPAGTRISAA
jgi:isopentenyl phosphate kinase